MAEALRAAQRAEENARLRLQLDGTREIRRRLEQFASRIGTSDGSNREALREWIDGIDHAYAYVGNQDNLVIEMVGYLTKGTLAKVVRERMLALRDGERTWDTCKKTIIDNFLNLNEMEYLRNKVENMSQGPYQDMRQYANNFALAVDKAYTDAEQRIDLIQKSLIKSFVKGIRDQTIRAQVHLQDKPTLAEVIREANKVSLALYKAEVETRNIEPMDISAIYPGDAAATANSKETGELKQLVKTLQGEVKSLRKTVEQERRGRSRTRRKPSFNAEGKPLCFSCQKYGHMARDCRSNQIATMVSEAVKQEVERNGGGKKKKKQGN